MRRGRSILLCEVVGSPVRLGSFAIRYFETRGRSRTRYLSSRCRGTLRTLRSSRARVGSERLGRRAAQSGLQRDPAPPPHRGGLLQRVPPSSALRPSTEASGRSSYPGRSLPPACMLRHLSCAKTRSWSRCRSRRGRFGNRYPDREASIPSRGHHRGFHCRPHLNPPRVRGGKEPVEGPAGTSIE